ncbi:hypothetical protein V6U77_25665 [Micromonospora sp. CPCC 205546]|uniref:hypothetical protein n=1 Tax=Micromonospora sp. CPCC 205546 TaxID=3122397 RepID=UPI002FEFBB0A
MFDFGIPGYQPSWLRARPDIETTHGARLAALAGRTLTHVWLVWDLDEDEWFADCPVLLDFAGEQVEVNHQKFDDLSITWNSVRPVGPVTWLATDDLRLAWRAEPLPGLAALPGRRLREVALLEWRGATGDLANGSLALGFAFADIELVVHNGLDENALTVGPPDPRYRRHPLGRANRPLAPVPPGAASDLGRSMPLEGPFPTKI